jgi:dinuclear metal center YbgI/SA1388 family protein
VTTDSRAAAGITVADVIAVVERHYPPHWAAEWDRVGLAVGAPKAAVTRIVLAVDCVAATVHQAIEAGAELMVVHHPLLLRGVHSVATTSYKGSLIHQLIRAGVAVYVAHTNADVATPGVSDALAQRIGLVDAVASDGEQRHPVRIGRLPSPTTLTQFTADVAARLPQTVAGVRAGGTPQRLIERVAVAAGAGDSFLAEVSRLGVDAYVTADLRHHPASEHLEAGGPALIDATHWASERPWLDLLAQQLRAQLPASIIVSDLVTDVWTVRGPARPHPEKEPHP